MLLKEIIEDADLLIENSTTLIQKIRFFNQIQRMIYRDFPNPLQTITFTTDPGVSLYSIPVSPDRVRQVFVDDQEYIYESPEDVNAGNVYSFANDELFIQPTPATALSGYVLFDGVPADVTSDDLNSEPPFLKDFHEVFSLGIAQKLALINKDYKSSAELETRFQNSLKNAMSQSVNRKSTSIRNVYGW